MKKFMFVLLLFAVGCSSQYGQLTVASTKSIDIQNKKLQKVKSDVTGTHSYPIIVLFPMGQPTIQGAIDDALKQGDGDLMMNATIVLKQWYIPYIYGETKFEVKGDIYKIVP